VREAPEDAYGQPFMDKLQKEASFTLGR